MTMPKKTLSPFWMLLIIAAMFGSALVLNVSQALAYPAWDGNFHPYAVNDLVTYNGRDYRCQQAHTSQPDWNPVATPALWVDLGPTTGGSTPTRTNTSSANTPTRTNTPIGPTPTRTNTPVGPTPTRTNTAVINATATRTSTPCSNCGGPLPKHVITGYWHNFNNGSTVMKLNAVPSAYNLIVVAFADATGTAGAVTFNLDPATGYSGTSEFISHISAINATSRKVIISVGGQNGTVSVTSSTAATNFANSIVGLMNTYGFAGVDIDLENGINATYMEQALRSIKSQKPNAIITMAPQTIDMQPGQVNGTGYFKLALNIRDILTIVNMQYYNSGSMNGCDGNVYSQGTINFLTALACIQLQAGLRPDQVGLGLPATSQAAGGGFVSPSVVNNALDCLAARTNCGSFVPPQSWPGIRGAMTWSINWDATSSYNWVNTINAHLPAVP
jgi:chitinase